MAGVPLSAGFDLAIRLVVHQHAQECPLHALMAYRAVVDRSKRDSNGRPSNLLLSWTTESVRQQHFTGLCYPA